MIRSGIFALILLLISSFGMAAVQLSTNIKITPPHTVREHIISKEIALEEKEEAFIYQEDDLHIKIKLLSQTCQSAVIEHDFYRRNPQGQYIKFSDPVIFASYEGEIASAILKSSELADSEPIETLKIELKITG